MKKLGIALAFAIISLVGVSYPLQAQETMFIQALILMDSNDAEHLSNIQAVIQTKGGDTLHMFPHRALIAKLPDGAQYSLADHDYVSGVFTETVDLSIIEKHDSEVVRFVNLWNYMNTTQTTLNVHRDVGQHLEQIEDSLVAPDLALVERQRNATATSITPGHYQTSEYMAGSIAVGIILVESDGSVDTSTEDWTPDETQLIFNEIVSALNWWSEREPRAHLNFVYDDHSTNPLPTSVEPVSRPYADQNIWITDAMESLGFSNVSYFGAVRDYINELRHTYQTDWAFAVFVVDSSTDSDNKFSDGRFAYAYLGGPFMVMTSGNNGYGPENMDAVAAHEIGHIFHAVDQYENAQKSCTLKVGYLNVENQNSQSGDCLSDVPSIMRGQVSPYQIGAVDEYARGQIGWRDSDGDNILDPLDTSLLVNILNISQVGSSVTITGNAEIIPHPSPQRTNLTINTLSNIHYRLNYGDWHPAIADDNVFDNIRESYHLTETIEPGLHTIDVLARDSADNVSEPYATQIFVVPEQGSKHAMIGIGTSMIEVDQGQLITVPLIVGNINALYSAQVRVAWDADILEIVDVDPTQNGIQALPGELFPHGALITLNTAEQTNGTLDFGITLGSTEPAIDGEGVLVYLTLYAKNTGSSPLMLTYARLYDPEAQSIQSSFWDSEIIVKSVLGNIAGQVRLDERSNVSQQAVGVTLSDMLTMTTSNDGMFSFNDIQAGFYDLALDHDLYLCANQTITVSAGMTHSVVITLTAGDVNDDGQIDAVDLALVAEKIFPVNDLAFDINVDGVTDIGDLSIVSRNLDQIGTCAASLSHLHTEFQKEFLFQNTVDENVLVTVSVSNTIDLIAFDLWFEYTSDATDHLALEPLGKFAQGNQSYVARQQAEDGQLRMAATLLGDTTPLTGDVMLFNGLVHLDQMEDFSLDLIGATLVTKGGNKVPNAMDYITIHFEPIPNTVRHQIHLPLVINTMGG